MTLHRIHAPANPSPLMHPMNVRQRTFVSTQMRNYILNAHIKSATDPRRLLPAWGKSGTQKHFTRYTQFLNNIDIVE